MEVLFSARTPFWPNHKPHIVFELPRK